MVQLAFLSDLFLTSSGGWEKRCIVRVGRCTCVSEAICCALTFLSFFIKRLFWVDTAQVTCFSCLKRKHRSSGNYSIYSSKVWKPVLCLSSCLSVSKELYYQYDALFPLWAASASEITFSCFLCSLCLVHNLPAPRTTSTLLRNLFWWIKPVKGHKTFNAFLFILNCDLYKYECLSIPYDR